MLNLHTRPKPRSAGGLSVCITSPQYRPIKRRPSLKCTTAVKIFLRKQSTQDARINHMLQEASAEWSTYQLREYHEWANLTPKEKQEALFSWILNQTRTRPAKPLDILSAGLAGLIWWEHHVQPRHDSYSRAVDCAKAVWHLNQKVYRSYSSDDGHGHHITKRVFVNRLVRLTSRHACQRIETEIRKQAGWILEAYRAELTEAIKKAGLIGV